MSRTISGRSANDNAPRERRKIVSGLTPDLPVSEFELVLVETYLSAIITELATGSESSPANDNMPAGEREG